jgi:ParB family chromosome partitioning protein
MLINEITTASPFRDLFPIRKRIQEDVMWDMRKNGYDNSQPIVLWKNQGNIVIDGHTRLTAARKANIYQVPVVFKNFSSVEEALKYAIACQKNRRNLSDSELAACVVELDKRLPSGYRSDLKVNLAQPCARLGKSAEETANLLGVSTRKVEQIRTVMDNANDDIKRMVKTGRMTINSAYNRTVGARKSPNEPFDYGKKTLDDFCAITINRFDREQLRYITDVFNKELEKPEPQKQQKEDINEST